MPEPAAVAEQAADQMKAVLVLVENGGLMEPRFPRECLEISECL